MTQHARIGKKGLATGKRMDIGAANTNRFNF
ncbi:hypothetical protein SEEC0006_13600 [Salmonella enterica subsp. enterica serovar Choleraesuis str. 0006]|nr:hypothetical protein SEEC0006_13600 [Salmonella enterica subsp. enterica serovar Choleraesuis str. 0006]